MVSVVRFFFLPLILLACWNLDAAGRTGRTETTDIFAKYKSRIVQVRILEASSGARAGHGSGFVANGAGLLVTNYHVISNLVLRPEHYRAEAVDVDNKTWSVTLLAFDAINDLAVLKTDMPYRGHFMLGSAALQKGRRVYSMGTPLDLAFSIVEGTYNGLIQDSLYEKIHYTGAINPGMSGGPAVLSNGQVVGVNVASAGNQIGFLVPVKFVVDLLKRSPVSPPPPESLLETLRAQLLANQDTFMTSLLKHPIKAMKLDRYAVPGKLAHYFKCWGDSKHRKENLYESVVQKCSFEDNIYISPFQRTGYIQYEHVLVTSKELKGVRFYNLYQHQFESDYDGPRADKEDVGQYRCHSDFVEHNRLTMKAALCLRGYKKLPGLYDAVLIAATLNEADRGVQTTVVLAGVSFDNVTRFAKQYLESMAWTR